MLWEFIVLRRIEELTRERNWSAVELLFRALGRVWEAEKPSETLLVLRR